MIVALHTWNVLATLLWLALYQSRLENLSDRQQPNVLASFVMAGVLSVILTLTFHMFYPGGVRAWIDSGDSWLRAFVGAGLPEELAKFLLFLFVLRAGKSLREPQDGVIYGAVTGMAFGAVENIGYIEQYASLTMFIRPVLTTGGHAIYGAIWGGLYSQAVYANTVGTDPAAKRNAALGILFTAVLHATYNFSTVSIPFLLGVRAIGLIIAVGIYRSAVELSPYKVYPLSQARRAVTSLRRGLVFNPKSPLLNRNMGMYLMHLREYKIAAEYLRASMPRSRNPRQARFLKAACQVRTLPRVHALPGLKRAWTLLSDGERSRYLSQLDRLVGDRDGIRQTLDELLASAFGPRKFYNTREKAQEIKGRRYGRKHRRAGERVEEQVATLSAEERERLTRRIRGSRV